MKLQILITQYNETEDIIRGMLTSISLQRGVDLKKDVEVIIANDGSDVKLSKEFLDSFSFPIKYLLCEHSGLPGCRAKLFDASTADYVMFCDADDEFFSHLGLHTIMRYIDRGFDAFASEFYEELCRDGKTVYNVRRNDCIFVHGKVYRRQYLIENNIVWHPELKCHQDSCFNILAQKSTKNFVYCKTPFYLWRWREGSICRADPYHIPKTYKDLIDSNDMLVRDFLARNDRRNAILYANASLYAAYYNLNGSIWQDLECVKHRYETEVRIKQFYNKYIALIASISEPDREFVIKSMRVQAESDGLVMERFSFPDWIRHIKNL